MSGFESLNPKVVHEFKQIQLSDKFDPSPPAYSAVADWSEETKRTIPSLSARWTGGRGARRSHC